MGTYFNAKVTFSISAKNPPEKLIEELEYALNAACTRLEEKLEKPTISYKIGDTFSDIYF